MHRDCPNRSEIRLTALFAFLAAAGAGVSSPAMAEDGYHVGDSFPGFTAQTLQGDAFSFDDVAGRYVLIDFCTIWCTPCQSMAPDADDVSDTLNSGGIDFTYVQSLMKDNVGLPADQADAQAWADALDVLSPPVTILHPGGVADSPMHQAFVGFGTEVVPTLVLLDPEGVILDIVVGYQSPEQLIDLVQSHADDPAPCSADVTGDAQVDISDLLAVLANWGECAAPCDSDTNGDEVIDINDLLNVLAAWGPCDS